MGDAGTGKTTELQRIAWHFSKSESKYVPFFVSLNKYVSQDIDELLGERWVGTPEAQTIIILDGLDEIEAKNKNDAIRKIELFAEKHQSSKILISSRTNFYSQEKDNETGTIRGFLSYVLTDLEYEEIKKFVERALEKKTNAFFDAVHDRSLGGLLKVPFYLVSLVRLFTENKDKLPETKNEILEYLLNDRLRLDSNHFRTTVELNIGRARVHGALKRLGLGMNLLGRNYISDDEYTAIISSDTLRTLLIYCTAWKRNDKPTITWQFEHNNFQEYLAAKALSEKSLDTIKDCISFKPDNRRIIPFWVNTLAFLLNMPGNEQLMAWITEIQPELLVKVEPSRVENALRVAIFKKIFYLYKQKKVWIPFDLYDYRELARFGQSEETVRFLLQELQESTHYTTSCNAIELLGFIDPSFCSSELQIVLTKLLLSTNENFGKEENERIQSYASITLAKLHLNTRERIEQAVSMFSSSQSHLLRSSLYYMIHKSDYLEEYIGIFLDSIQQIEYNPNVEDDLTREGITEERRNLLTGLEKAKSRDAIKRILTFLVEYSEKLPHHSLVERSLSTIASNASNFAEDPNVFTLAIDFVVSLSSKFDEECIKKFIPFFNKSGTRTRAFSDLISRKNETYIIPMSWIADEQCLNLFVEQYLAGKIPEKDVWWFQHLLGMTDHGLSLSFNSLINEKSGNKFILPKPRDFEQERKNRVILDIALLFNKSQFVDEISDIFRKANQETLTNKELLNITSNRWNEEFSSDLAFHTLLQMLKDKPLTLNDIKLNIEKGDWDFFCVSEVYRFFDNGQVEKLTREQIDWISNWCISNAPKVNFKRALIRNEKGASTRQYCDNSVVLPA